jgi:hypothetical protein
MDRDYMRYAERAKSAVSPAERTISMLGMLCAAAAEQGAVVAFVGRGYASGWPDPRIGNDRTRGSQSAPRDGFGPNFPRNSEEDL